MSPLPRDPIEEHTINEFKWLAGIWLGERGKNQFEEHWSGAVSGSMMGMFRWIEEGQVSFYEIQTLSQIDDNIVLRIKHFNEELISWEDKEESLTFDLVEAESNSWLFYQRNVKDKFWVRYTLVNDKTFEVTFLPEDDLEKPIKPFVFKRK